MTTQRNRAARMVILQSTTSPEAFRHYRSTVVNSIELARIGKFAGPAEMVELSRIYPDGTAKMWGISPRHREWWDMLQRCDVSLFARHGYIFAAAGVTYKMASQALALDLWNNGSGGSTWELIYFMDIPKPINISYTDFNKALGHDLNLIIPEFGMLDEHESATVIDTFGL